MNANEAKVACIFNFPKQSRFIFIQFQSHAQSVFE
jgi:hypothetical protein